MNLNTQFMLQNKRYYTVRYQVNFPLVNNENDCTAYLAVMKGSKRNIGQRNLTSSDNIARIRLLLERRYISIHLSSYCFSSECEIIESNIKLEMETFNIIQ